MNEDSCSESSTELSQQAPGCTTEGAGTGPGGLCSTESPSNSVVIQDANIFLQVEKYWRIIGYRDLRDLLQPKHEYFKDKKAWIKEYRRYIPEGRLRGYLYPVISGKDGRMPKNNPFRKHQLAESHTARRINMIVRLIEKYKLDDFKIAFLTLTMPQEISSWLSKRNRVRKVKKYGWNVGTKNVNTGIEMAWRMYQRFWNWYDETLGPGLSASVNLHTWKTEKPLEPHYHFHCLIPNYMMKETDIKDNEGESTYSLVKQPWFRNKKGTIVPLSDDKMELEKNKWREILIGFSHRNKISWAEDKIDLHIEYSSWDNVLGKRLLMHWFNYQGRYSLEDYVYYSNENTDCPSPPEWLRGYENHSRSYGWWRNMKVICGVIKLEIIKRDVLTGKPMKYLGTLKLWNVLDTGPIGYLDIVKGNPIFHRLRGDEIAWLVTVDSTSSREDGIMTLSRPVY